MLLGHSKLSPLPRPVHLHNLHMNEPLLLQHPPHLRCCRWRTAQRLHAIGRLPPDTQDLLALGLGSVWLPCTTPAVPMHPGVGAVPAATGQGGLELASPCGSNTVQAMVAGSACSGGSSIGGSGSMAGAAGAAVQWGVVGEVPRPGAHELGSGCAHTRMAWLACVALRTWQGAAAERRRLGGLLAGHRRKVGATRGGMGDCWVLRVLGMLHVLVIGEQELHLESTLGGWVAWAGWRTTTRCIVGQCREGPGWE